MRHALILVCLLFFPLESKADSDALNLAMTAIAAQDFETAEQATRRLTDPVAQDIVAWTRLRAREGNFSEYIAFLDRRSDWPGLPLLRARGERNIPESASSQDVIAYFAPQPPETGTGSLRLIAALREAGRDAEARTEIQRAWTQMTLSADEAQEFLSRYSAELAGHHIARLDNLLWEGEETRAREMLPRVPADWRALAEARMALRARRDGVDGLIEAIPSSLSNDAGLAYERFVWRMRAGFWDSARDLMAARSGSAESLGRPERWADRRATLVRDVMREGGYAEAYRLATPHHMTADDDASDFAELEWLAGYTALTSGNAAASVAHFERFRDTVVSPISMGRAGYWLGRAHEANGNPEQAAQGYALGAQFQSSFYGQLAAERGNLPTDPEFLGRETFAPWQQASFTNSSVLHAALLLYQAGQLDLSERFLTHLTESLSRAEAGQLAELAFSLNEPHFALMIAKRAATYGHEIMRAYYPVTDLAVTRLDAPAPLVLAITRRESEFNPDVISPAGALGLMQVMPRTGRAQAERMGLSFAESALRSDPDFNARIGAGYLGYLSGYYGSNPVLLAAAYNAGPSRADEWIERFGDPRDPNVDIVQWIESVPFTETRNYIMRVTESLPIYEARLSGEISAPNLSALLQQR